MPQLYLGLMSGTSMDGVDAVLCDFDGTRYRGLLARHHTPYSASLRARLLALQREHRPLAPPEWSRLDNEVADHYASAAQELLRQSQRAAAEISALGAHGQTVFHDPDGVRSSVQLGNPSLIAARVGITTVADFRRADIAHGGQGAPLVPAFHHAVFAAAGEARVVVNIGGIANITLLPDADPGQVRGFDCGPGNGLMDEWAERCLSQPADLGGRFAASGALHEALLAALQRDPYFARPAPKSTGRDYFNLEWAMRRFPDLQRLAAADVQRTFCELTAATIARAIEAAAPGTRRVLLCGGGARNEFLVMRLRDRLPGTAIEDTDRHGLPTAAVEGAAFAWLAMRSLNQLPGNLPAVTGARRAVVLGGIYRA